MTDDGRWGSYMWEKKRALTCIQILTIEKTLKELAYFNLSLYYHLIALLDSSSVTI